MKKSHNLSFFIYANSSPEIGGGHVLRQLALAQQAQSIGIHVSFMYHYCNVDLLARLKAGGFSTIQLKTDDFTDFNSDDLINITIDVLIIDDYLLTLSQKKSLAQLASLVVVFDDETDQDEIFAGIIINSAEHITPKDYQKRNNTAHLLLGCEYRLIRQEFLGAPARNNLHDIRENRRILITLGASDAKQLTLELVQRLLAVEPDLPLDIVMGSMAELDKALWQNITSSHKNIVLHENVKDMSMLMSNAGLAITSAGGTLFELACLGIPCIALCVVSNQLPALNSSLNHSGYLGFDLSQAEDSDGMVSMLLPIIDTALHLWQQPDERLKMSKYLHQKIDGLGSQRIMAAIIHDFEQHTNA